MEQTAVEWLVEQIEEKGESWENVSIGRTQISIKVEDYLNLIAQAKEMEKQQIVETFIDSRILSITNNCNNGEQYYNETFNKTI